MSEKWAIASGVTAQLVNCNTETHLWSSRYDRNLDDIFAVQSDIAENVVSALKVKLLDQEKNALQHKGPKNSEAYVEYLRGVHFRHKQPVELNFRKAVEHLEKAVQLEPNYAEAFALLGEAWGNLAYFGYEPRDKANAKARQLVSKALELDDTIPEAHCSRASEAYFIEGNLTKADEELRRAIELNPNNLDAHLRYAILLSSLGCNNEAIIEIEKCLRLDPVSAGVHNIAGPIYFFAGRIAEALDHHRTAAELEPVSGHTNLGITLLDIGSTEEGVKELEIALKQGGSSFFKGNLGCAYAISGRKEDAQRILNDIKADTNRAPRSYALANIYACLGEKEEALDWLERAYEDRSIYTFPLLHIEPFLANLREEPRFKELVRKMGLEKYQTGPTIK